MDTGTLQLVDDLSIPQILEACRQGLQLVILQGVRVFSHSPAIDLISDACSVYFGAVDVALSDCHTPDESEFQACMDRHLGVSQ